MVQGDHVSELSGFLLGNNLGRTGKKGSAAASALPMLLPGSSGPPTGLLEPLAQMRIASQRKEQVAIAEEVSAKLAAELIAEEEEEKAQREKKKAKKKGKKDKQKEKKKAASGKDAVGGASEEEDDDEDEVAETVGGASGGAARPGCAACGGCAPSSLPARHAERHPPDSSSPPEHRPKGASRDASSTNNGLGRAASLAANTLPANGHATRAGAGRTGSSALLLGGGAVAQAAASLIAQAEAGDGLDEGAEP